MNTAKAQTTLRLVFLCLLTLFIVSILPVLIIGLNSIPAADDFTYSAGVYHTVLSGGSFAEILQAAFSQAALSFQTWQGTFSSIFLMALQPAVFGEQYYAVVTILMLFMLAAGNYAIIQSVLSDLFGFSRTVSGILWLLVSFLCIQFVPSPSAAFFWYNSAVHYTFFHALILFALSLSIRIMRRRKLLSVLLLCLLCFLIGGSNYTCSLSFAILGFSGIVLLLIMKHPAWKHLCMPYVIFLLAFIINIRAPGNTVRQDSIRDAISYQPDAVHAILSSFYWGFHDSIHWFRFPEIGALLFSLPVIWHTLPDREFRFPWLVTVYSYCLISALYCPSYYAMDGVAERTLNVIYFSYLLLLFLNAVCWMGWLKQKFRKPHAAFIPLWQAAVGSVLFLFGCILFIRTGGTVTSALALHDLRTGQVEGYRSTYLERLTVLHDPEQKDVVFDYAEYYPVLLPGLDYTADPDNWVNKAVADYYDKDSIVMRNS